MNKPCHTAVFYMIFLPSIFFFFHSPLFFSCCKNRGVSRPRFLHFMNSLPLRGGAPVQLGRKGERF